MSEEHDDTIRLNAPRRGRRRPLLPIVFGLALAAGLGAAGAWWGLHGADVPAPRVEAAAAPARSVAPPQADPVTPASVVVVPPRPIAPPPPYEPPLASEAEILADSPEHLAVYRFAAQPSVVVLQFPSLAEQGRMLNRVAALVEKAGFPRDRVVNDAELEAGIRAIGASPDTFYYGHDYSAGSLRRFFDLAEAVPLNDSEKRLHELVGQLGWHADGARGALISLVRQTGDASLDPAARATILRHELSHGLYFTDPAYAAFVHRFWNEDMTAQDRARFTALLTRDGYDPALDDLIINETQAYLMYTADPRFFSAQEVGLPEARLEALRRRFLAEMPAGWLRDRTTIPPGAPPPAVQPVRAPRRRSARRRVRGGRR